MAALNLSLLLFFHISLVVLDVFLLKIYFNFQCHYNINNILIPKFHVKESHFIIDFYEFMIINSRTVYLKCC